VNGPDFPGFGCVRENFEIFPLRLDPGPHVLLVSIEVSGFATSTLEPVPKPTTLLLLGSVLVPAVWAARRRKRGSDG
jgi:hypothetical protein